MQKEKEADRLKSTVDDSPCHLSSCHIKKNKKESWYLEVLNKICLQNFAQMNANS